MAGAEPRKRRTRISWLVPIACLLALMTAGCSQPKEHFASYRIERPTWHPGYEFTYAGPNGEQPFTVHVITDELRHQGDMYVASWNLGDEADYDSARLIEIRQDDLSRQSPWVNPVDPQELEHGRICQKGPNCIVRFEPAFLDFPLITGNDGKIRQQIGDPYLAQYLGETSHIQSTVFFQAPVGVESPFLGSVEAFRILIEYEVQNPSQRMLDNASRIEQETGQDPLRFSLDLYYSKEHYNLVLARGSGGENETAPYQFGSFFYGWLTPLPEYWLKSVKLTPQPAMSTDDMLRYWG